MSGLKPYWPYVVAALLASTLATVASVGIPRFIRVVIDQGVRSAQRGVILSGTLFILGLGLFRAIGGFLAGRWTEVASQGVAFDLRNRFHAKLQKLSFSFHDKSETGQLLARSVADVDRVRILTGRASVRILETAALIIGIGVSMFIMNSRLALPTLTIVPFLAFGAIRYSSLTRPVSVKIRDREADLTTRLEQNLRGARIVKAFGKEDDEIRRFSDRNKDLLDAHVEEVRIQATYNPLLQLTISAGTVIVIMYGGVLIINGSLSIGELVAFLAYVALLLGPVRKIGILVSAIVRASASAERIFAILDLNPEIKNQPGARELKRVRGDIHLEAVSLAYSLNNNALINVDLEIKSGERLALIGATGAGKTSIASLIPRFYDPSEGSVRIDGVDIRTVRLDSLRSNVGVVLQDTVLFAASIRENISFGRPGAVQREIENAAKAAGAHDFIAKMDQGYNSHIGEQGVTLSGGQKQRISIARAILKDPAILILDDATSSVDTETEEQIQEALGRLMVGRTSIVIAQRLSTIRTADAVVLMDHGRIDTVARRDAERSPHEVLLETSPLYAEIVAHQLKPAEIA